MKTASEAAPRRVNGATRRDFRLGGDVDALERDLDRVAPIEHAPAGADHAGELAVEGDHGDFGVASLDDGEVRGGDVRAVGGEEVRPLADHFRRASVVGFRVEAEAEAPVGARGEDGFEATLAGDDDALVVAYEDSTDHDSTSLL